VMVCRGLSQMKLFNVLMFMIKIYVFQVHSNLSIGKFDVSGLAT
jgi:hypothetical protein